MGTELKACPYESGDEFSILDLFQQTYGHDLSAQVWAWRFRDGPAGAGVIELAWDGDVLAAHYAVTPVELYVDGRAWVSGLSGTTMTHPDYRGRGLFPMLAHRAYSRMAELGMAMVWGFPNALSHRGFVRSLAWVDIYEIPTFRMMLSGSLPWPAPDDAVVELVGFDGRFDRLWQQIQHEHRIIGCRCQKHLHWRYIQHPAEHYRILAYVDVGGVQGYAVFKRYLEDLQVVDLLTVRDPEVGVRLLSQLGQIGLEESVAAISLWLNVTHPLHHTLERFGFQNGEPVAYFGGKVLQPSLETVGLYDFRQWYVTMGDSDVF